MTTSPGPPHAFLPPPELIDAHCHLLWPTIAQDRPEIIARAHQDGIAAFLNIGISPADFQPCIRLHTAHPTVFNVIGIHPEESMAGKWDIRTFLHTFRAHQDEFCAIGEIGLDFYQAKDHALRALQEKDFRAQLALAAEIHKPVVIHCRNAEKQAIKILEEPPYEEIPGVLLHCFGGAQKHLDRALTHDNWAFTIPTSVVYKKLHRILAMRAPLERQMLETDSPFLAPFPGLPYNEPRYVRQVANEIAQLREVPMKEVAQQTTENARRFFGLPRP